MKLFYLASAGLLLAPQIAVAKAGDLMKVASKLNVDSDAACVANLVMLKSSMTKSTSDNMKSAEGQELLGKVSNALEYYVGRLSTRSGTPGQYNSVIGALSNLEAEGLAELSIACLDDFEAGRVQALTSLLSK